MDRIDSHNAIPTLPEANAPETTPGYFTDGDGQDGTVVSALWLNAVQEELLNVIRDADIEPNRANFTQLLSAIKSIIEQLPFVVQIKEKSDDAFTLGTDGKALAQAAKDAADEAKGIAEGNGLRLTPVEEGIESLEAQNVDINTRITTATGTFMTIPTEVDLDDFYDAAAKVCIVDPDSASIPPSLEVPIFLEVMVNDDDTLVTQNVWDSTGAHVFTRCASVNRSEIESPIVTWTPWNSVAVPEIVKDVQVEVDPDDQPKGTYLVITMESEEGDVPVYINMTQLIGSTYVAGNNGITISSDYKIGLKLSDTPGGLVIDTDGLKYVPGSGDGTVSRSDVWTTADITANSSYTLDFSYVVGSKKLFVHADNLLLAQGTTDRHQYEEVGTSGATSTTIKFKYDVPAGTLITYYTFA